MKKLITLIIVLLSPLSLQAHERPEPPAASHKEQNIISASQPVLSARYETLIKAADTDAEQKPESWQFIRDDNQVEIRQSVLGEIWYRHSNGELSYAWLQHAEEMVVRYNTTDLKILEKNRKWHSISSLLDPALLNPLSITGSSHFEDYKLEEYQLVADGLLWTVHWLPELGIPAYIEQPLGDGSLMQVRLKAVQPMQNIKTEFSDIDDYWDLDFADLGDNEAHPMARFLLHGSQQQQGRHQH